MNEQYTDAYGDPIREGFYRNRDNGGIFRVKKENEEFVLIDAAVPERKFLPAQLITNKLALIMNPQHEISALRKRANWLENQLKES